MDKTWPAVIVAAAVVGLLSLMWRSWRARARRDAGLFAGYPFPGGQPPVLVSASVFYVATTPRDLPLERLVIPGLGFRARATLTVTRDGVVLEPAGGERVFIPADEIELLTRATWTIDRVVETDGLLVLGWSARDAGATPSRSVDTYIRLPDPSDRIRVTQAVRSIAPGAVSPSIESETA